jgi:predicted porin
MLTGDSGGYGPLWHAMYFNFNTPSQGISNSTSNGLYGDTAWDRQIIYTLPKIGNAEVNLHYAPNSGSASGNNYGANILDFDGPLALTAYYSSTQVMPIGNSEIGMDIFTPANNSAQAYMAGASYNFGVAKVFLTYQDAKQTSNNTELKTFQQVRKYLQVLVLSCRYANTNYTSNLLALNTSIGGVSSTVNEYVIGYDYPLDAKTDAYINYGYTSASNATATGYVYGGGIRMKF